MLFLLFFTLHTDSFKITMLSVIFKLSDADSCSLNAAVFTSQNEIFTGNSRGMIKLWDLRATTDKPVQSASLAEDSEVTTTM